MVKFKCKKNIKDFISDLVQLFVIAVVPLFAFLVMAFLIARLFLYVCL